MIINFPPKKPAPAPAKPGGPQGWPPGLRRLVDEITALGMPSYPIAPNR